jgi:hypothetical protein
MQNMPLVPWHRKAFGGALRTGGIYGLHHQGGYLMRSGIRVRRPVAGRALIAAVTLSTIGMVAANTATAHADITHVTHVYDVPSTNDPAPFGQQMEVKLNIPAGCDHMPGIRREGHYWTLADISTGEVGIHIELTTHYNVAAATAMAAYNEIYHTPMPCPTADWFESVGTYAADGAGDLTALRDVVCGTGSPDATSRFCQLATRPWYGQTMPSQVRMGMQQCRAYFIATDPLGNTLADVRAYDFAMWSNLHVFVQQKSGFNVYINDINQRLGVAPTEANGTTDLTKPLVPYGKVQTYFASNLWVRFYDAAARALGKDPVATPVAAYNAVDTAIANNRSAYFTDVVWGIPGTYNLPVQEQLVQGAVRAGDAVGRRRAGRQLARRLRAAVHAGGERCDHGWRDSGDRAARRAHPRYVRRRLPLRVSPLGGRGVELHTGLRAPREQWCDTGFAQGIERWLVGADDHRVGVAQPRRDGADRSVQQLCGEARSRLRPPEPRAQPGEALQRPHLRLLGCPARASLCV